MGSGKTTIGRLLAKRMKVKFYDLDEEISRIYKMDITNIFEIYGEGYFRSIESKVLKAIINEDGILSTGGGTVIFNEQFLKKSNVPIFLLEASIINIVKRISLDTSRPLVNSKSTKDLIELKKQRNDVYFRNADKVFYTDNLTPQEVVDKIIVEFK